MEKEAYCQEGNDGGAHDVEATTEAQDIANFLQPYCTRLREVTGSVKWVTNMQGIHARTAFVGFDHLGEAEAFTKAVSGRIKGLGSSPIVARLVGDKKIPGFKPREAVALLMLLERTRDPCGFCFSRK
jgi:hypothetical protein